MPPWKPLPCVCPAMSTSWPATKWSAEISAPTSSSASSSTRNSTSFAFGSTSALPKWPRSRLGEVLRFRGAGAELDRDIAVAIRLAARDDLHAFEAQDGDRHMAAVVLEQAGHPHFLGDHASAHDPFLSYQRLPDREERDQQKGPGCPRTQPNSDMPPSGLIFHRLRREDGDSVGSMLPGIPALPSRRPKPTKSDAARIGAARRQPLRPA